MHQFELVMSDFAHLTPVDKASFALHLNSFAKDLGLVQSEAAFSIKQINPAFHKPDWHAATTLSFLFSWHHSLHGQDEWPQQFLNTRFSMTALPALQPAPVFPAGVLIWLAHVRVENTHCPILQRYLCRPDRNHFYLRNTLLMHWSFADFFCVRHFH